MTLPTLPVSEHAEKKGLHYHPNSSEDTFSILLRNAPRGGYLVFWSKSLYIPLNKGVGAGISSLIRSQVLYKKGIHFHCVEVWHMMKAFRKLASYLVLKTLIFFINKDEVNNFRPFSSDSWKANHFIHCKRQIRPD